MKNIRYNNYHKHDHRGNPWSMDVIAKEDDYCKRAVELGHTTCFTTNHGVAGSIFAWMESAKQYGLKMCYGMEAYYVNDRFEPDRTNNHLIIIARNNRGVEQINDIMTEALTTGFYYRPRVDKELVMSLNPHDVILTTACVAGIWNNPELIMMFASYFKDSFFLELQDHCIGMQELANKKLLDLHRYTGIPIIHANDSHYIYPEDSQYRDIFLRGKGRKIEREQGMILDYPDSDEIFRRYKRQGILTESEVQEALENTWVFDDCEEITLINDEVKLPPISDNPTEELETIVSESWSREKANIPPEQHKKYLKEIRGEMKTIQDTHMENYFLIDYYVVKRAQEEYGGVLTNTGRGSAPSFYTTKLLGLTDIDRIASPITLFPSRFMSVERIIEGRNLPDIDLNTSDREPFIKATEDLLGKENCAWMLAWKPLQDASAFRLYCKGIGLNISEYDDVAKDLDSYREDKKWKEIIEDSKRFVGVVEGVSESPCSMLLYDKPVRKELGLVRTPNGKICCLLDGYNCDKYKYLKDDFLTTTVWAIIRDVCKESNIPIPTIKELDNLLDEQTFDIYKNGLTCTVNQVDSDWATELVKTYKPHSVAEMSGFVAIIRPGCASLLQGFIHRKPYTTGVPELDELLEDSGHRMIYQESIMKYLIWLGVKEAGSYDIIKKIAKKKFKAPELARLHKKLLRGWEKKIGNTDKFEATWQVVQDAAKYSFNASHSLSYAYDSLYGAYLKSHYPLQYYTVVFNYYSSDTTRTSKLQKELAHWNITLNPARFRYSKSGYTAVPETNSIYKGIASIKNLNPTVADEMYLLKDNHYSNFMELRYDLKEKASITSRQVKILIELDFFEEFGDAGMLLSLDSLFDRFYGKKQISKTVLDDYNIPADVVKLFATKETAKMFTGIDMRGLLTNIQPVATPVKWTITDKVKSQIEYLGYTEISGKEYAGLAAVISVNTKYSPKADLYSLKNGTIIPCKIKKPMFRKAPLSVGDVILIKGKKRDVKYRKNNNGGFDIVPGEYELWITLYEKIK